MGTLVHADIFFFVTTIAVIVVGICFSVALIYLALVLRRIRDIADHVREETILFREDIHGLREQVKHVGFEIKPFLAFFRNLIHRKKSKRSKV